MSRLPHVVALLGWCALLTASGAAQRERFWSFRPVRPVAVPRPADSGWPRTDIDRFVLARLEREGLTPGPDAAPGTWLRRITFDLTGLPPEPEAITAFLGDASARARTRVVDRLLASPAFGERWGRHWLDVARFAESSGGGRSLMFQNAWRFRDYVIESYDADVPFDRFLIEQIAGDLLPFETDAERNRQLVASGFLALGPTNYEQQDKELLRMDVIDEQIDTIGRAFMGLTLGCARCHDHKFDPIPTTDYYALAGILGSTQTLTPGNVSGWVEHELLGAATKTWHAYQKRYLEVEEQLVEVRHRLGRKKGLRTAIRRDALRGIVLDDVDATLIGEWKLSRHHRGYLGQGYLHDENTGKGEKSATFTPAVAKAGLYEVRLSYTSGSNRATNVPVEIEGADGRRLVTLDQQRPPPLSGFVSLGTFRLAAGMANVISISNRDTDGHVIVDGLQLVEAGGAGGKAPARARGAAHGVLAARAAELEAKLRRLRQGAPPKPPRAMAVHDVARPGDGHLHVRGLVRQLGPGVPRGFVTVCAPAPARIPAGASGRLELARWLTDPRHPLTARVYVNRIWHWMLGAGLVRTTDNFGTKGEPPSHPDLLDFLARRLVEGGWSTKKLVREIALSRVYGLGSSAGPWRDPENRLLSRANRRRLDAEAIRDAILTASGELDRTRGGATIRKPAQYDLGYEFDTDRRSVYVPAFRNSTLDLFRVFDGANSNIVTGRRNTSNVPSQALFLMNSPWVIRQARHAARRLLQRGGGDAALLDRAWLAALGRRPSDAEHDLARRRLQVPGTRTEAWASLFHALFACLDFRYLH